MTSVGFAILVFALFKPFGMGDLGWIVYIHLAVIWVLGIGGCYVTEAILKYILHMPASFDQGAEYIIRRNLRFQLINTPLMTLMVCVYLHFAMSAHGLPSPLTWLGYLSMLFILAFCSFTIGVYWRFKYRIQYLTAELAETKKLNERIETIKASKNNSITLYGTTSESVTLDIANLLYIESIGNYVKVIYLDTKNMLTSQMLRSTSKQMEETLKDYPMVVRCHRAFLVNLAQVEKIISQSGTMQLLIKHSHDTLPVSRSNIAQVKAAFAH